MILKLTNADETNSYKITLFIDNFKTLYNFYNFVIVEIVLFTKAYSSLNTTRVMH